MWLGSNQLVTAAVLTALSGAFLEVAAAIPDPIPVKLSNHGIDRLVDLTTPSVRESYGITVKNEDKVSADAYYFVLNARAADTLAYQEAWRDDPSKAKKNKELDEKRLKNQKIARDTSYNDNKWTVYKIILDPPIAPGESTVLGLRMAYTNRYLQVQPERVPQDKSQYLRWESSATIRSPYFSEEQSTKIRVPSQYVESYSKGPEPMKRSEAGNEFTYGPYKDVEANAARKPIYLHYEQNISPITAVDHKRQLEVSHWGGYLAVEEHYNIRHDGAKLEGEFSRITFQKSGYLLETTPVLSFIPIQLPTSAERIYYRDPIGNVSTSVVVNNGEHIGLQLRPRFPLYGGWQYRYYYGYDQPLSEVLSHVPGTNTYVLKVPFLEKIASWTYTTSELRILLPEGARNIQVKTPFAFDEKRFGRVRTYLDVAGRTAIWLVKHNAVDEHSQIIEIHYEYSTFDLLRKPIGVFLAFMALFIVAMLYSRLDLSIARK